MNQQTAKKIGETIDAAYQALMAGQPDENVMEILVSGLKGITDPIIEKIVEWFTRLLQIRKDQGVRAVEETFLYEKPTIISGLKLPIDAFENKIKATRSDDISGNKRLTKK